MRKELSICFRTTENIKKPLEQIAKKSRKSVSSVLDNIIYNYLGENKSLKVLQKERREFPRKKVHLPALFHDASTQSGDIKTCTVLDISLGGLLVSVPLGSKLEITKKNGQAIKFEIILPLPESFQPIEITCQSQRISKTEKDVRVGADFVDTNFQSCQILQKYLI